MERYDICPIDGVLMPDETGDWVKFEEANARIKELEEALKEAEIQIEYMHRKFGQTGSGNNVLSRIQTALNK